jgi:hypothetical protein
VRNDKLSAPLFRAVLLCFEHRLAHFGVASVPLLSDCAAS